MTSSQTESEGFDLPEFKLSDSSPKPHLAPGGNLISKGGAPSIFKSIRPKNLQIKSPPTSSRSMNYKMSKKDLEQETNDEVRNLLRYELNAAVSHFLGRDVPVYLEGLGIIFPELHTEFRSDFKDDKVRVWRETYRTVVFEKCYELISLHREKFPEIVETKELVQWIYPRLPIFITAQWVDRDIRKFLRGIIDGIKQEVIRRGRSAELSSIGELLCLHNRQGNNFAEWYAGADIFVKATYRYTISTNKPESFQRPVVANAWKILEAAFGPSVTEFSVDLAKELAGLGYDPTLLPSDQESTFKVGAFYAQAEEEGKGTWIFCSEGLRKLGLSSEYSKGFGNELVFQLSGKALEQIPGVSTEAPIHLAARPLTVGWMLLMSSRSKTAKVGAGLAVETGLFPSQFLGTTRNLRRSPSARGEMKMVFVTPFSKVRSEQLSCDGPFVYLNLIAITDDESALASESTPEFLLTLLEHRRLTQITSPFRPSLLARTELSPREQSTPPPDNESHSSKAVAS